MATVLTREQIVAARTEAQQAYQAAMVAAAKAEGLFDGLTRLLTALDAADAVAASAAPASDAPSPQPTEVTPDLDVPPTTLPLS